MARSTRSITEPPTIADAELLERLAISDDAFPDYFLELVAHFPGREWTTEQFERGLRYPWYRPARSYLLQDDDMQELHELEPAARVAVLERHLVPTRVPLLAFGSNAAPKNLAIKLAHHEEPEEREVLVLAGELHELDVVAAAAVTVYGAMPATLAASPGTAVRAAVLLVTATQLTTLTWGEMTYRLGRLHHAPFVVEDGIEGVEFDAPLAYVSRWGAYAPEGAPAALAAIPATGRRFRAWSQRELLDHVAALVLGPDGGGAEALTQQVFGDAGAIAPHVLPALRRHAQPFDFTGWAPIATDGRMR